MTKSAITQLATFTEMHVRLWENKMN